MSTETHTTLNVFYLRPLAGEVEMQRDACESIRELVGDNGYEAEGEEQNTDEQNTKGGDVVHGHKHKPPFKMPLKDLGAEKIRRRVAGVKVASCQPTDASKSVADLHERIEWSCKNSCGFHAAFQQVCAHERTCDLKASASQKPMPHPCQFFGTAVDGVTLADGSQDAQVSSTGNGSGFIPWKEAVATPLRGLTDEKELVYVLCDWTPEENAPNKMRVRRGQRILVSLSTDRGWSYGEILAGGGLIFLWGASTRTADTTISPPFPIQRPRLTPPAMRATGLSPIATTTLEYAFCTLPGLVLSVDGRNAQDYRTHILERWF
jgi:hypothetical protein